MTDLEPWGVRICYRCGREFDKESGMALSPKIWPVQKRSEWPCADCKYLIEREDRDPWHHAS